MRSIEEWLERDVDELNGCPRVRVMDEPTLVYDNARQVAAAHKRN